MRMTWIHKHWDPEYIAMAKKVINKAVSFLFIRLEPFSYISTQDARVP
jgi:hypothetical protein